MPDAAFQSWIDQAVQFGYGTFNLAPLVGDPLLDPSFLNKLAYLDGHPGVKFYCFSSNLTNADARFFSAIGPLTKLRWFSVSLYGLNPLDYQKATGAPGAVFLKVLRNLDRLSRTDSVAGRCEVKVRGPGPRSNSAPLPECAEILARLEKQGIQIRHGVRVQNWGGLITKREMDDLDADFKTVESKRPWPCVFLFHKPNILPDGTVNACSCGDGHARLSIGNVAQEELAEIFSAANPRYLRILQGQMAGRFPPPCGNCSGYRPLDRAWYSYQYYDREFVSPGAFWAWLSDNTQGIAARGNDAE